MSKVITIQPVERKQTKVIIGLSGFQGSGKTGTALRLAYGLANYDPSKIGVLDCENMRAALESNIFTKDKNHPSDKKWLIANLDAPYSPERYQAAIQEFAETGIEVLVIDGASPEWDGQGGVLDIAAKSTRKGQGKWQDPKSRHKTCFVNTILHVPFHVIITFRAKEKLVETADKKVVSAGLVPIWEKSMGYDLTIWLEMADGGNYHKDSKTHEDIKAVTSKKGKLTAEDGFAILEWITKGVSLDPAIERSFNYLRQLADNGLKELEEAWDRAPENIKNTLTIDGRYEMLVEKAKAIDEEYSDNPKTEKAPEIIDPDEIV